MPLAEIPTYVSSYLYQKNLLGNLKTKILLYGPTLADAGNDRIYPDKEINNAIEYLYKDCCNFS
jgi:hypothetical protein